MFAKIPLRPKFDSKRLIISIIEDFYNPITTLPPLYFQINPQTFDIAYAKKINRYQTFDGFVEEYWGDELDTITCNGSTGGFLSADLGLETIGRAKTTPYFKFQDILDVYRNNGNVYDERGRILKKGKIVVSFDPGTYFGYFENFNYTEDANAPFRFTFDFTFKAQKSHTGI